MPNYEERKQFIINVLFVGFIAAIIFICLRFVIPYTLPFIIGFFIAFLLKPITAFITKKTPFRRKAVSIVVIAFFYILLSSIVLTILAIIFTQMGRLVNKLPQLYSEGLEPVLAGINNFIYDVLKGHTPTAAGQLGEFFDLVSTTLKNAIRDISSSAVVWITHAIKGLPMFVTTLLFTIISSIMISVDYSRISSFILKQFTPKYRNMILDAKSFMINSLFKMLKAYIIIMAITMTELTIGLWLLDVDLALAIGAIIAMLDVLPLIGTGGILIPWSIIELTKQNYYLGFGLLILFFLVSVIRNIIEPKIVGNQIGLHPVVTLAAMYLGLKIFGFIGLLLAPLAALLIQYLNDKGKIRVYKT